MARCEVRSNRRPILGRKPRFRNSLFTGNGIGQSSIWGPMSDIEVSSSDNEMHTEHDMRIDSSSSSSEDCIVFDISQPAPSSSNCENTHSRYTPGLLNLDSKPASPTLCGNEDFFSSFDRSPSLSPLIGMSCGFFRDCESHSQANSPSAYQSTGFFRESELVSASSSTAPSVIGSGYVKGSDMDYESLVGLSNGIGAFSETTVAVDRRNGPVSSSTSNMSEVGGYRSLSMADLHIAVPVLPVPMLTNQAFLQENVHYQTAHSQEDTTRYCVFCKKNRETREFYRTHVLKDPWGTVICPVLRKYVCRICGATGNNAHTLRHCPSRDNLNI